MSAAKSAGGHYRPSARSEADTSYDEFQGGADDGLLSADRTEVLEVGAQEVAGPEDGQWHEGQLSMIAKRCYRPEAEVA